MLIHNSVCFGDGGLIVCYISILSGVVVDRADRLRKIKFICRR